MAPRGSIFSAVPAVFLGYMILLIGLIARLTHLKIRFVGWGI